MIEFFKRLLGSTGSSSGQESEDLRREVYGEPWEWGRAGEQPYDHYTDAVEDIKQLKRDRRHEDVEELLLWCIDYTEAEARAEETMSTAPAPAYYRHLGIVYRKDDRHQDEVEILERYVDVCQDLGEDPDDDLVARLERARELASQ
jgi:hypothetical protein